MTIDLSGYVDVADRIASFHETFPDGSLQSDLVLMQEPFGWLCTAYAYRTADDSKPGVGHAFEQIPGKTPYTKDSEAMNAETSAWGRAIVALGFKTQTIASRQEVAARENNGAASAPAAVPPIPSREAAGTVVKEFGNETYKGKTVAELAEDGKGRSHLQWIAGDDFQPRNPGQQWFKAAARVWLDIDQPAAAPEADAPTDDEGIPFLWIDGYGRELGTWRDPWRRG